MAGRPAGGAGMTGPLKLNVRIPTHAQFAPWSCCRPQARWTPLAVTGLLLCLEVSCRPLYFSRWVLKASGPDWNDSAL